MSTRTLSNLQSLDQTNTEKHCPHMMLDKISCIEQRFVEQRFVEQRSVGKPDCLIMCLQDLCSRPFCWQVCRILHMHHTLTHQLGSLPQCLQCVLLYLSNF